MRSVSSHISINTALYMNTRAGVKHDTYGSDEFSILCTQLLQHKRCFQEINKLYASFYLRGKTMYVHIIPPWMWSYHLCWEHPNLVYVSILGSGNQHINGAAGAANYGEYIP